jgi:hypothetical protein
VNQEPEYEIITIMEDMLSELISPETFKYKLRQILGDMAESSSRELQNEVDEELIKRERLEVTLDEKEDYIEDLKKQIISLGAEPVEE